MLQAPSSPPMLRPLQGTRTRVLTRSTPTRHSPRRADTRGAAKRDPGAEQAGPGVGRRRHPEGRQPPRLPEWAGCRSAGSAPPPDVSACLRRRSHGDRCSPASGRDRSPDWALRVGGHAPGHAPGSSRPLPGDAAMRLPARGRAPLSLPADTRPGATPPRRGGVQGSLVHAKPESAGVTTEPEPVPALPPEGSSWRPGTVAKRGNKEMGQTGRSGRPPKMGDVNE